MKVSRKQLIPLNSADIENSKKGKSSHDREPIGYRRTDSEIQAQQIEGHIQ